MDFDLGAGAAELRTRLRTLIEQHFDPGFLGALCNYVERTDCW